MRPLLSLGISGIALIVVCPPGQAAPPFHIHRAAPIRFLVPPQRVVTPFRIQPGRPLIFRRLAIPLPLHHRLHPFYHVNRYALSYGSYGGYGGYSGGYSTYGGYPSGSPSGEWQLTFAQQLPGPPNLVDALGLPNHEGMLEWPVGLRVLPPPSEELRRQIDALVNLAAEQAAGGKISPAIVQAATRAIDSLDAILFNRQNVLASVTVEEARSFLAQIESVLKSGE